jgi:hypothetical protein
MNADCIGFEGLIVGCNCGLIQNSVVSCGKKSGAGSVSSSVFEHSISKGVDRPPGVCLPE